MMKVTVIMPSLNVKPYIRQCMDSVCQQSLSELEILCIDAGSTDGTREILEEYAKKDVRVRLIHSEKKSYGYQVNLGLQMATGKYVAILETDDYIVPKMYENLYRMAEEYKLDYVKADYDTVLCLENGEMFQERFYTLREHKDWYGKVIGPEQLCCMYISDTTLWKGIYRRTFLEQNHIRLNETPGAAYQDVGFIVQTLAKAQKAMYLEESFYRYRVDREDASTWNPNCFSFIYREAKWLMESGIIDGFSQRHREACMERLALGFYGEYRKALQRYDYNVENDAIAEPYQWFVRTLLPWLENKVEVVSSDFKSNVIEIKRTLTDNTKWALEWKEKTEKETLFYNKLQETSFVIVGAGIRGKNLCKNCLRRKIVPLAFADNNPDARGQVIDNIQVLSVEECVQMYPDIRYVLSMKNGVEEVKKQLSELGVCDENMVFFE